MKVTNAITSFKANKMSTMQARYVDRKLKEAKNVDIITHDMTDRDGANSALAMWEYLNNQGINARVIISKKVPQALGLRNYNCNIVQAMDDNEVRKITPDVAFCVDFGGAERVLPNVKEHIEKAPIVMGFDHHSEVDISRGNYVQFRRPLFDDEQVFTKADFYSDMSAKSATSIIYRFFEALGQDTDSNQAYDLFFGLVDDMTKRNLVKCDGTKGTITAQKALFEDKNAFEIYSKLKEKLDSEQISTIAKSVDLISSLNPAQQQFKDSLKDRLQYSENGKIVYLEIPADDSEWENLDGDNTITSTILNRFRQEILANDDEVEAVICFYEAHGNYRLSAHTKNPELLDFFKYVEENKIPNFSQNSGGHPTRGGGGIKTNDPNVCHNWVLDIISCDEFFEK